MTPENQPRNNHLAAIFQEKTVPAATRLAGWGNLVQTFGVQAPVRRPSVISDQHVKASRRMEGRLARLRQTILARRVLRRPDGIRAAP